MDPDFTYFTDCEEPSCLGHLAGWYWAQDNDVEDASQCPGSDSFNSGCVAYCNQLNDANAASSTTSGTNPDGTASTTDQSSSSTRS